MRVHSVLNRFFNGTPAEASSGPDITVDDQDLTVLPSLQKALTEAAEKFARNELATPYGIDGTRWSLTGIEVFVRATTPQQLAELKRKPARVLKRIAMHAVMASDRYRKMFVVDEQNFFGVTVDAAPDTSDADWINVLGAYGKNETISYAIAFLGDYTDAAPNAQSFTDKANSAEGGTDVGGGKSTNTASWNTPTPLLGDAHLLLQSNALQVRGPGLESVLSNTENVCNQFPVVLGRAAEGMHPWDKPVDVQGQWVPLFGSVFVSKQHLTIDKNEQGQLTVTDTSSNGTWLNGERLPKGQAVLLPPSGTLSLVRDSAKTHDAAQAVTIQYTHDFADASAALTTAGTTASAPKASSLWPFAKGASSQADPVQAHNASSLGRQEPSWDISRDIDRDLKITMQASDSHMGTIPTDITGTLAGWSVPTDIGTAADARLADALAVLRVRHADGTESVHPILEFPCQIGREALGDIRPECSKVSRVHLRLEGLHGRTACQVSNLAHDRNGTYNAGRREEARFVVPLAQASTQSGWLTLGDARLLPTSVQVRIEKP